MVNFNNSKTPKKKKSVHHYEYESDQELSVKKISGNALIGEEDVKTT